MTAGWITGSTAGRVALAALALVGVGGWLVVAGPGRADGAPPCGVASGSATVAVVDSGIAPVLDDRVVRRIDLVGQGALDPHGTAVAGIVAAGAPSARLVDVRVLDARGRASATRLAAGIDAALDAEVDLVNLSTTVPDDDAVVAALTRADRAGIAVVIAAGNDGRDLDRSSRWRALAARPCIEVVGATADDGSDLVGTNRGVVVEVRADGDAVPTIDPDGGPTVVSGTSAAAAVRTAARAR